MACEQVAWTLLRQRTEAVATGKYTGVETRKVTLADLRALLKTHNEVKGLKSWNRASRAFDKVLTH